MYFLTRFSFSLAGTPPPSQADSPAQWSGRTLCSLPVKIITFFKNMSFLFIFLFFCRRSRVGGHPGPAALPPRGHHIGQRHHQEQQQQGEEEDNRIRIFIPNMFPHFLPRFLCWQKSVAKKNFCVKKYKRNPMRENAHSRRKYIIEKAFWHNLCADIRRVFFPLYF